MATKRGAPERQEGNCREQQPQQHSARDAEVIEERRCCGGAKLNRGCSAKNQAGGINVGLTPVSCGICSQATDSSAVVVGTAGAAANLFLTGVLRHL